MRQAQPTSVERFRRRVVVIWNTHPRVFVATGVAIAVYLMLPASLDLSSKLLIAWSIGGSLYIVTTWWMMTSASVQQVRRRAVERDERDGVIVLIIVAASVSSLAAIVAELYGLKNEATPAAPWRLALASLTIFISWFLVHTTMALHYAHEYYGEGNMRAGLDFPGDEKDVGYWDFLYFSFTVGATAQTSDVAVVTPGMRKVVLMHGILSFLFNTTILALLINVGAGAL
ncbi:DUF1345 domain-containing protein [Prosthecomicrobium sp. N25]|uniref:DUF1345 domain-containing protein n=1 Tax=Prosthecomicrobium sp. N25 TaxID=3129254 RepID=UPI0030782908